MNRPPIYTPELAQEVLDRLIDGKSLRKICDEPGMPSRATVLRWLAADVDGFEAKYASARVAQLMGEADDLLEIADTPEFGTKEVSKATGLEITTGDMIEHRKLKISTRQWLLAKLVPKKYGDKQHIEHSGTVSIADALRAAREKRGTE